MESYLDVIPEELLDIIYIQFMMLLFNMKTIFNITIFKNIVIRLSFWNSLFKQLDFSIINRELICVALQRKLIGNRLYSFLTKLIKVKKILIKL